MPSRPFRRQVGRRSRHNGRTGRARRSRPRPSHASRARAGTCADSRKPLMSASAFFIAGEKSTSGPLALRTSPAVGLCAATRRPVSAMTSSIMRVIRRRTVSCTRRGGSSAGGRASISRTMSPTIGNGGDIVEREQIGAQAVVDVVGVVGDVVRQAPRPALPRSAATTIPDPGFCCRRGSPPARRVRDSARAAGRRGR